VNSRDADESRAVLPKSTRYFVVTWPSLGASRSRSHRRGKFVPQVNFHRGDRLSGCRGRNATAGLSSLLAPPTP